MFKRLLTSATLFGMAALAPPAHAMNCAPRDALVDRLESRYSEALAAGGLQSDTPGGSVMEIWASPETGSFTVLVTMPSGMSCIVAAGTDFFTIAPLAQTKGTPS